MDEEEEDGEIGHYRGREEELGRRRGSREEEEDREVSAMFHRDTLLARL